MIKHLPLFFGDRGVPCHAPGQADALPCCPWRIQCEPTGEEGDDVFAGNVRISPPAIKRTWRSGPSRREQRHFAMKGEAYVEDRE